MRLYLLKQMSNKNLILQNCLPCPVDTMRVIGSDEKFCTKNLAITILAITTYYFYFEKGCVMKHMNMQLLKKSQYRSAAPEAVLEF